MGHPGYIKLVVPVWMGIIMTRMKMLHVHSSFTNSNNYQAVE